MRASSPLVLAMAALLLAGCAPQAPRTDPNRMASLKHDYDRLHERLEKAAAAEPLVASALADRGQVVLAIRSGLIEELAGNVARHYLDRVTVDLSDVEGHSSGELRRRTFLGRIKVGEWSVSVDLGNLTGHLRAGSPRVSLRGPDLVDVELPVDVQETEGDAMVRLGWDSTGLANVVCKDFELTREIRGRVLAQRHLVSGALRFHNNGESLTATPVFPERRIRLKLDLTAPSWGVVEAALRSQDTSGKCGALMDPDKGLVRLRALAARGIRVRLPDSIFRAVSLPARLQKSVKVSQRTVELQLTAESLRIETATLWSSVSVQVQAGTKPFVPRPGTRKGSSYSSPAENVINLNLKEQTDALLKTLTPREERVIKMRFGIGDGSEHTLEDVGQSFQVTRERVRQTEAKALRKLRHPSRSRKLKAFLEGSRI